VAYVVGYEGDASNWSALREQLKRMLPDYMVPAAYVSLPALPLTHNGKLDRKALPAPEFDAAVSDSTYVAPRTPTEAVLAGIWESVLRIKRVGVFDKFFEIGGDSILSLLVVSRANQSGLRITPKQMFQHPTIAGLAAVAEAIERPAASNEPVTGAVPLTAIQSWFFEQDFCDPHHWNQAIMLRAEPDLDPTLLERGLQALIDHHDALRLRFRRSAAGWLQINAGLGERVQLSRVDLSARSEAEREQALQEAAADLNARLDLAGGPLLRAAWFDFGGQQAGRLLIVIHHLAVDGVSWRILLEDLQAACERLRNGQAVELAAKTTSFQQWAERIGAYARSGMLEQELPHWLAVSSSAGRHVPVDFPGGSNVEASTRVVSVSLNPEETSALLQQVPSVYNTRINDVLLTALCATLTRWCGGADIVIDLEGHGREELIDGLDLSRTVGWFTALYPVRLTVNEGAGPGELLKSIKEQLRAVPGQGIGYGLLRYLGRDTEAAASLRAAAPPDVAFNYLGQFNQALQPGAMVSLLAQAAGPTHSPRARRPHLLEINGLIAGARLRFDWSYSETLHRQDTVRQQAEAFLTTLRGLIRHCLSDQAGGFTPSDFPEANLAQQDLDRLSANVGPNIERLYPLSPMQQGMLFHSLLDASSGVYVTQLVLTLTDVNIAALRAAWERVLRHHDVLRTLFVWQAQDKPLQVVRRDVELPWEELDWRGIDQADRREKLDALLRADRARGFDLRAAPLMRLMLIRSGADRHELVWSHHHLLLDGWSVALIAKELAAVYQALVQGREHHPALPRPYQDYIAWLQRQDIAKAEAFWRRSLQGFTAPTTLTVERGGRDDARRQDQSEEQSHDWSASSSAALKAFASQHNLTLSTLFHGAWAVLLSRYSGEDDVLFGSVASGRPADLVGADSMVGLFINTLAVRTSVPDDEAVIAWLTGLQEHLLELRGYDYSSLVDVQGWSAIPRDQPLFETLLVFENYPVDPALLSNKNGLNIGGVHFADQLDTPLAIIVMPGEALRVRALYNARRFDRETISRLLGHLEVILQAMVAEPERALDRLPLLTAAEQRQIMEWNASGIDYPRNRCVHELFEQQVERTPNAIAAVFEGASLTYRDLNQRSNRLAHRLQSRGVKSGATVGLCFNRSLEMIVALLATLKAGGAYVPLDPSYPQERLRLILAESGMLLVLTQPGASSALPSCGIDVLSLDSERERIVLESAENPVFDGGPDSLAYVLYTSGSTGRPKGVAMTHGPLCNLIHWQCDDAASARPKTLQFASLNFDVSFQEIFSTLACGATMVVASQRDRDDPVALLQCLREQSIERLFLPFVALRQLAETAAATRTVPSSLREVITAGEQLQITPEIRWLFNQLDGCRLQNQYGPTESHVVTAFTMPESAQEWPLLPPIGRPIANAKIHILDRNMNPVPIGVSGEIYIGGTVLARGYLDQPDLTSERFIAAPFGTDPDARLYKSGDIGRYLPDGNIQYIGRNDGQVKVRGYRVEPGEVEATLSSHPGVRQAAVIAVGERERDSRLVAYVMMASHRTVDERELKSFLESRVPAYMVPSRFVPIDTIPLTPSGKLDRKALLDADHGTARSSIAYVAPRSNVEIVLAGIWARALGLEQVSVGDDFFDLGGHSLSAVRAINDVNRTLHLKLGVAALFQHRTIERLAASIARSEQSVVVRMADGDADPPIYVVYAGSHQFRIARFFGGKRPVFGMDIPLRSAWCTAAAEKRNSELPSMQELVEPYLDALKAHAGLRPCILLGHCFAGLIAFELAHRFKELGGTVEKVILLDSSPLVVRPLRVAMRQIHQHWTGGDNGFAAARAPGLATSLKKTGQTLWWVVGQYARHGWWRLKKGLLGMPPATMTGMRDESGNFIEFPTLMEIYNKIYLTYVPRRLDASGLLVKAEPLSANDKPYRDFDPALGWEGLFAGGLDIVQAKGNHIAIVEIDENLAGLARDVNALLERDLIESSGKTEEGPKELLLAS
jgi:amino acid adenylation domain-containing protein/non-ribosomal peptide synthase protein (TIGR01720 family)